MKLVHFSAVLVLAAVAASVPDASSSEAQDPADCLIVQVEDADGPEAAADESIQCLLRKIERLERELGPFRNAKGAVLAFDRSEGATASRSGGACPAGWSRFQPAQGRMLIGAGQLANGLTNYPAFSDDPDRATGGEEEVLLLESQMPSHTHLLFAGETGVIKRFPSADEHVARGAKSSHKVSNIYQQYEIRGHAGEPRFGKSGAAGGNQPHNNMPPYIALYFCKKD